MRARTHILLFTSLVFFASGCTTTEETSEAAAGAKSPAETPVGVCLAVDPALEHSPLSVTLHRLVERKGLNVVAGNAPVSACRVEVRLKGRWNESFTELLDASLSYRDLLTGETRQVDQPQSPPTAPPRPRTCSGVWWTASSPTATARNSCGRRNESALPVDYVFLRKKISSISSCVV